MGIRKRKRYPQGEVKMTCQEAINRLYEYLDRELDNAAATEIENHLDLCRLCCDHFEFEQKMKELVHNSCLSEKAPQILKDKILNRLK
jgi:mycothiol system anti-sigma-R factor